MSDVVATSFTPDVASGTGRRTFGVVAALAHHGPVHVLYTPFGGDAPAPEYEAVPGVTLEAVPSSRGGRRALAVAAAIAREGTPPELARAASPELRAAVAERAGASGRVIADGPTAAGTLLGLARHRPCTYLAHNLESAFRSTFGLAAFERRVLRTYAESWMCTRGDVDGAELLAPQAAGRVRVVRNVVPVPDAPLPPPASPGRRAILVADYRYAPNAEAAAWLQDEVMPRVWAQLEDATVVLVGRGLPEPPADPRVTAPGFVEDVGAAYAQADAVLVPLLRGGGSPLKFAEGLATGRPVVATTHAAALLEEGRAGEHYLAADGAQAFADALIAVLRDGAPELGRAGHALARRVLSVQAVVAAVAPVHAAHPR